MREHPPGTHASATQGAIPPAPVQAKTILPGQRTLVAAFALGVLILIAAMGAAIFLAMAGNETLRSVAGWSASGSEPQAPGLPPASVPKVEPVRYLEVDRENARKINAAVPFSTAANPPASPYIVRLAPAEHGRALDCLASAAWYEAGDDMIGQQAVVQVVLNRVRHPSFPKSICGTVFQGSERRTGCQFSFTCDGSMVRRRPSAEAWGRARGTASAALYGLVFPSVGWATHYHTDWVVPYWSRSVDKLAAVDTHLFFRWAGAAGRPPAFNGRHSGIEPVIEKLAALSPAHAAQSDLAIAEQAAEALASEVTVASPVPAMAAPVPAELLRGHRLLDRDPQSNSYLIQVLEEPFAGTLALMSLDVCNLESESACAVYATSAPAGELDALGRPRRGLAVEFRYVRDKLRGREQVQWNCARWNRPAPSQCLAESQAAAP